MSNSVWSVAIEGVKGVKGVEAATVRVNDGILEFVSADASEIVFYVAAGRLIYAGRHKAETGEEKTPE